MSLVGGASAVSSSPSSVSTSVPPSLRSMSKLVSPFGLVSTLTWLPVAEGEPEFAVYSGSLGNPGAALAGHGDWVNDPVAGNFDGAGGALDHDLAAHLAVAESLERYSSCVWRDDQLIWATAAELGDDAIAPARWPQCSPSELADPRSGLVASDPHLPLRWVSCWSLTRRRPVFVPASQIYLRFPPESAAERYLHPVSTGCAAHTDPVEAVVNGLCEVVERDSIALTWLQRMPLPRLDFTLADLAGDDRDFVQRGLSSDVTTHLFDATTDLGIPVLYGVQTSEHDAALAQLVVATCTPDPGRGLAKLFREAASLRIALRAAAAGQRPDAPPVEDTMSVIGGALEAGSRERRDRFDFLLEGERPHHRLADLSRPARPDAALPWLLDRLHTAGCEVVVADLTTDEARQVGAHVVRVLVPELMPLSFAHRARYLAHPRLYQAPAALGHRVHREPEVNPHPQPFA